MKIVGKSFQDNREKLVQFIGQGSIFLPLLACSSLRILLKVLTICFAFFFGGFWPNITAIAAECDYVVFYYRNSFHRHSFLYVCQKKNIFGLIFYTCFSHTFLKVLFCFLKSNKRVLTDKCDFLSSVFPLVKAQISKPIFAKHTYAWSHNKCK